jgi:hypothetical protein
VRRVLRKELTRFDIQRTELIGTGEVLVGRHAAAASLPA